MRTSRLASMGLLREENDTSQGRKTNIITSRQFNKIMNKKKHTPKNNILLTQDSSF